MERRGQERDREREIGSYRPAESPVKLPLAAILSTPTDRRSGNNNNNNATLPTRRGSSIFSPTQTLDHHLLPQLHHHRHNITPPPPQPPPPPPHILVKDPSPDPDPSTPTPDGTSNSRTPPSPPQQPPPPPAEDQNNSVIRYRECLKNHAASMGGHVVDGCGEFMPNGDDGTAESLRCAACDCHRNFHRKEVDGEAQPSNFHHYSSNRTPLLNNQTPPLLPSAHRQQQGFSAAGMVHFGGGGGGADESSSEDLNMYQSSGGGMGSKKRFRTKFSQEQKDRMQELAEKMEWRIQKQDEQLVQKLCEETGVKRQVFKVWMHNNKQAMKKKHFHQI